MAHSSRICLTSKGSTIDALGGGQYRVCDQAQCCTVTEGLWAAYESLRELEQKRIRWFTDRLRVVWTAQKSVQSELLIPLHWGSESALPARSELPVLAVCCCPPCLLSSESFLFMHEGFHWVFTQLVSEDASIALGFALKRLITEIEVITQHHQKWNFWLEWKEVASLFLPIFLITKSIEIRRIPLRFKYFATS